MARQHFYSRVPARVSLYNRCDGFDTFIKSGDLSDELVRGELRVMYDEKLNIHDPVKVRRGEIPTVYSQMKLEIGEVAQTTIKYLPTDFTGERSAYLAHTLVLDAADRAAAFCTSRLSMSHFILRLSARFVKQCRSAMPIVCNRSGFP